MPQEITESSASDSKTAFEIGLERRTSVTRLGLAVSPTVPLCACSSRASGRHPSVRTRPSGDIPDAPLGQRETWHSTMRENRCQTYVTIGVPASRMLRFLRVRNLAVIDTVDVEFEPGLNVLTGETGAGKSILVEAVGLLLGGRASGDLVRTGEDTAAIEAIFEQGDEELLVRREITAQGRSRAFVNGALATAGALKDLSARLIELHGQHEHQTLLDPSTHLAVVDAFGGLDSLSSPMAMAFDAWRATEDELARVRAIQHDRDARLDLMTFQLAELDKA